MAKTVCLFQRKWIRIYFSICKCSIMANRIVFINEYFGLDISIDLFHCCSINYCSSLWHSISKILIRSMQFISFFFIRRENHVFYFFGQLWWFLCYLLMVLWLYFLFENINNRFNYFIIIVLSFILFRIIDQSNK